MITDKKEVIEDYKSQINELFEDVYIDPENPESLIEVKRSLLSNAFECFKWGSAIILFGYPIWSSTTVFIYDQIRLDQPVFSLETTYFESGSFAIFFEWVMSFIGYFFLIIGLCNLYVTLNNGIEYLKLGRKLKKAKELKKGLKNLIKNNIGVPDLETKTYLNFLEYHTNKKKKENPPKIKKNKINPIRRPRYLDTKLPSNLKTRSDFLNFKKNKIRPIRDKWYVK